MKLRTFDVIILLLLAILSIARSTWGLVKDLTVDLTKTKSVTGSVVYADIVKVEESTFRFKKHKAVFLLKLENSDENFTIDRGAEFCSYLKTVITPGDTVTVLYRHSTGKYNSFVFQLEKKHRILADLKGYKEKQGGFIILGYGFGFLILAGLYFWYREKKN